MGVLESGPEAIDWWVPGLRELIGVLLGVWLAVALLLVVIGVAVMLRWRRARSSGEIGPQAYRWRSENRFRFYGLIAAAGFMIVPGFFYVIVFLGLDSLEPDGVCGACVLGAQLRLAGSPRPQRLRTATRTANS